MTTGIDEGDDDEDFPLWAIIVAAVGGMAVLIAILILTILLIRCTKKSSK